MGLFSFLKQNSDGSISDFIVDYWSKETMLTNLALEIGINRISDVIAKCGFKVQSTDDIEQADVQYQLNVKPNPNQTATDFWKQAVCRMIKDPEGCAIINLKQGLFIADSWQCDKSVIKEKKYSNITLNVNDDLYPISKTFKASEVVHLRYTNPTLLALLDKANGKIDEAFSVAVGGFKVKAPKIKVTVPTGLTLRDAITGEIITTNQYADKIAEQLSEDEIKAIISHSGMDVSTIDMKSSLSSADISALRDVIFGNVAMALGIPKSVLFGDVENQANSEFITYACEPIISIIDNAITGAWISREEYDAGNRIYVDKLCVKHIDVIESAGNLDKLYQNGWSHNDILNLLGQPTINEEWADKRRFTKNYAEDGEGGELNE